MGIGFQFEQPTGWEKKTKQFAGKWDQDSPRPLLSGPSVEKQKQQMIKLRN